MPRARNIKPSFFCNDLLAECAPLSRILFIGLWTISDREGRLEFRAKKIKAQILPYDDCDVNALLKQLNQAGFISMYDVDNISYIQIVSFTKHQNPHMKEAASTIPAPDKNSSSTEQALPLTESLLLNPDTPLLNPDTLNGVSGETKNINEQFDIFYDAYNNKKSPPAAKKAFEKAIKKTTLDEMMDAIKEYDKYLQGVDINKKYPATWLNQECWNDEYPTEQKHQNKKFSVIDDMIADAEALEGVNYETIN